jgi:hypothetical protein
VRGSVCRWRETGRVRVKRRGGWKREVCMNKRSRPSP